ncbi:MAG: multicopper oxidase domain-containing protein, partial [Chloroflexota bacterium]|nr:multicopper oxidase domain-containing protein [Chloroflexota bacterium]
MSTRRKRLTRRTLVVGGGLAGCCTLGVGGGVGIGWFVAGNQDWSNAGDLSFANPLNIPPLADAAVDADGRLVWDLTIQTGASDLLPGALTETWGIDGPLLAPTLRARRGDVVAPVLHNALPEDTTIHWHGMHLPAVMDGGPHQMIPTGETWSPSWTVDQPAATLWYHPHPHGTTAEHVYKGVAGMFILDDDETDAVGLPGEYGVDDIPLILQDRTFDDDGQLDLSEPAAIGLFGRTMLVNGTIDPHLEIMRPLTRFRVLNGSNTRFYNLAFSDEREFALVATENGLLPDGPAMLDQLLVGPGERVEIVVACAAGESVVLRSTPHDLGTGFFSFDNVGQDDTIDLIELRAADDLGEREALSNWTMPSTRRPEVPDGATMRSFRLGGHNTINGQEMDMSRIDEVVPAGALEIWEIESSGQPHTFHIHGATYWVLGNGGDDPPLHLLGPKDTVLVSPDHSMRLAVQFGDHTDPGTPYMYHCHLLRHEDNGMMGQFVVVEPG